jgi:cytoskeletal protein RodZ
MAAPVLASVGRERAPRDAASAGADLRRARQASGLSVEELSRRTKITARNIRNLETDQFDKLPAPVFLRGFLRAYSNEVGLDPQETTARYLARNHPIMETSDAPAESEHSPNRADRLFEINDAVVAAVRALPAAWLLIAGLLAAIGYGIARGGTDARHPPPRAASSASAQPATPSTTPAARAEVGTAGSATDFASAPATNVLRVAIRTQGPCWVAATVDGSKVIYRLMQPGETQTIEAREDARFRIGDAGAFTFAINGAPARSAGRSGEAVNIHITKQNYTSFLLNTGVGTTGR